MEIKGAQSAEPATASEHRSEDLDRDAAELAARAQTGDQGAFTHLYLRYFDQIYTYMGFAGVDEQAAGDATQQVFIQALAALPSFDPSAEPWHAWLFRIARKEAIERLGSRSRLAADPAEVERPGEPIEAADLRALRWTSDEELMLLIERLPMAQRQVLSLRYLLGPDCCDEPEVAQILGRSQTSVRQLHDQAVRFLEQRLAALSREPGDAKRRLPMSGLGRHGALRPGHGFTRAHPPA